MKKIFCLAALLLMVVASIAAKSDKIPQYDITCAGSGTEGTILVKVYVYSTNVSDKDLKRAAVHGVVFRGCAKNASGARQPAMALPTAETENAAFCKTFFSADGACQGFASIINGSYDRIKTSKGYKTGAIVQVNKASLRKDLEKAGVVRALSSGF